MKLLYSPVVLASAAGAALLVLLHSVNGELWTVSFAGLALAIWAAGGRKAYPVLLWGIAFFWLAVAGDLGAADLLGVSITDDPIGSYRKLAILYSLAAMLVMALGMRFGVGLGKRAAGAGGAIEEGPVELGRRMNLRRLLLCYLGSLLLGELLSVLARLLPSAAQPLMAFDLIHYVLLFLIVATVFQTQRGYLWLLLVVAAAMASGMVGYWASYKEPVFVVILAVAVLPRKLSPREWGIVLVGFVVTVWISLVWTSIKGEYRDEVAYLPIKQRVGWLTDAYLEKPIDYGDASETLLERIGYTQFLTLILLNQDAGDSDNTNFYLAAIEHVLTPRLFFPDKPTLNDSAITNRLLHYNINSQETSIGVGYVAEAYVDFGFPGLLVPLCLIGIMLGAVAHYFMTRRLPIAVRQAFATAVLFLAFPFAADIDKALGGFLTGVIAMAVAAKFGYPPLAGWLGAGYAELAASLEESVAS